MTISDSLREELKSPLGYLIPEINVNKTSIEKIIVGKYVITVGDRTTEKMIQFGFTPSLQIIDNQERRKKRKELDSTNISNHLKCDNPAAEITESSINVIKTAFELKPPVRIIVCGEEDLLVIPACMFAPDKSLVLYGQPHQGLVVVNVTDKIRHKTQNILNLINGV